MFDNHFCSFPPSTLGNRFILFSFSFNVSCVVLVFAHQDQFFNLPKPFPCVSTGTDAQTENPQEGLREHLKKTLEFCLSRCVDLNNLTLDCFTLHYITLRYTECVLD